MLTVAERYDSIQFSAQVQQRRLHRMYDRPPDRMELIRGDPMELGSAERRSGNMFLCYTCGKPGHMRRNCLKKHKAAKAVGKSGRASENGTFTWC